MRSLHVTARCAAGGAVLAVALATAVAVGPAALRADARLNGSPRSSTTQEFATLISSRPVEPNRVLQTWRCGGATYTVLAPADLPKQKHSSSSSVLGGSASAAVQGTAIDKSGPHAAARAEAAYRRSGQTPYKELLELGVCPAAAAQTISRWSGQAGSG